MGRVCCIVSFLLVFLPSLALANWSDDFFIDYDSFGLTTAIEKALLLNVAPEEILAFTMRNPGKFGINQVLRALYCAGADVDAVREAADRLGIPADEVRKALELSMAECGVIP